MKDDKLKSAPETVALREAAVRWAEASRSIPITNDDREFKRIDMALRRAAIEYAAVVCANPDCPTCGDT